MKILVTGATGFIGTHLINYIGSKTKFEIIATSRDKQKAANFNWFSKIKYIPYDISHSKNINLLEYFGKPDRVIHLAWNGLPNYNNPNHIENNLIDNYKFIKNLLTNGLKEITVIGTCFEYGLVEGCLSEDLHTNPSNSYAIAKDSLRKFVQELKREFEFNYKWIRLFYMYGEGQSKGSLISLLDQAIESGEIEFNMSGGEQQRDYLHINEVVSNIFDIAIQNEVDNQIINCCSGKPVKIKDFVNDYLKEKNYSMKLNLGYFPYSEHEPMSFWGDNKKLNSILRNKK